LTVLREAGASKEKRQEQSKEGRIVTERDSSHSDSLLNLVADMNASLLEKLQSAGGHAA
jgi:hypothetical protein